MAYRQDCDLEFLKNVKSEDLEPLVYFLTHDPTDNQLRLSETLTKSEEYKAHYPEHSKYWQQIVAELQCYGGHTVVNFLRGNKGVEYREILMDVCSNLKVKYSKKAPINKIEAELLAKMLGIALEKMTQEEQKVFLRKASILTDLTHNFSSADSLLSTISSSVKPILSINICQAFTSQINSIVTGIKGNPEASYMTNLMSSAVAGAKIGAVGTVGIGVVSMTPLLLPAFLSSLAVAPFSVFFLANPAYRVTIPACLYIAQLRKQFEMSPEEVLFVQKRSEAFEKLAMALQACQERERELLGIFVLLREVGKVFNLPNCSETAFMILSLPPKNEEQIKFLAKDYSFLNIKETIEFSIQECSLKKEYIQKLFQSFYTFLECDLKTTQEKIEALEKQKQLLSLIETL